MTARKPPVPRGRRRGSCNSISSPGGISKVHKRRASQASKRQRGGADLGHDPQSAAHSGIDEKVAFRVLEQPAQDRQWFRELRTREDAEAAHDGAALPREKWLFDCD